MAQDLLERHDRLKKQVDQLRPPMESLRQLLKFCEPYVKARSQNTVPHYMLAHIPLGDSWLRTLHESVEKWRHYDTIAVLVNLHIIGGELARLYNTCPYVIFQLRSIHSISSPDLLADSQGRYEAQDKLAIVKECLASSKHVNGLMEISVMDATLLVNVLDDVMNSIESYDNLYSTVFHTLRKVCVKHGILPTSLTAPTQDLVFTSDGPVAHGGFAEVWRGRLGRQDVAVKVIKARAKDPVDAVLKSFCREAITWNRLSHARILPFFGINKQHTHFSMVCKWMPNGDLTSYVTGNPQANRPLLILDIAHGLKYIHSDAVGIVHGDLKGPNILVDEFGRACLSDFGLTTILYRPDTVNLMTRVSVFSSTARWMAPELHDPERFGLEEGNPTKESDVYSFSMVMWEAFTGRVPYDESQRDAQVINKVITGRRPTRPADATSLGLSDSVWKTMEDCWKEERNKRPRMSSVLQNLKKSFYFTDQSIPSPEHLQLDNPPVSKHRSDIKPGSIVKELKITLDAVRISEIPEETLNISTGKWLLNYTLMWERCRDFRPHRGYTGIIKTSWRSKNEGNVAPWDCRVTKHYPNDITFEQLWLYRASKRYNFEKSYNRAFKSARCISELSINHAVWSVRYGLGFLERERVFHISRTIFLDNRSPRRGLIVSRPVNLPDEHIAEKTSTLGRYAGVEQIAELEDGRTEWRLVETWDLGGRWKAANKARDGPIAQDVVDFFRWYNNTENRGPGL